MSSVEHKQWRFLTNHTQVLLGIARDDEVRIRDLAQIVGITERAAQRIVSDLIEAGYVTRARHGRRNRYAVNRDAAMRHRAQDGHDIGELLSLFELPESTNGQPSSQLDGR